MKTTKWNQKNASIVGFGAWQLGNPLWSSMTDEQAVLLVQEAIASGVTVFDTAPGYTNGKSETILGKVLPAYREQVVIISKFGHTADGKEDFRSSSIRNAMIDSLKRLNTSYLDALLLHNPNHLILNQETDHFDVLRNMKEEGLIRDFGVSIDSKEEFLLAFQVDGIGVIEVLSNVFFQECIPFFSEAHKKGIKVLIKVPLDSGFLSGKYDENAVFTGIRARWSRDTILRRAQLVKQIQAFVHEQDISKYALSYLASFEGCTSILVGVSKQEQLESNIQNSNYQLTSEVKNFLSSLYQKEIKDSPLPW